MQEKVDTMVSLYVVKTAYNKYFAGFNVEKGVANFVDDPKAGKKFTNKYNIKLRPDESLVELVVDLASANVSVSEPFRPHRKQRAPLAK